jgi:hypothetical protein
MATALAQGQTLAGGASIGWNIWYLPPFPAVPRAAGIPQLFVPGQAYDQPLIVTDSFLSLVSVASLPATQQNFFQQLGIFQQVYLYNITIRNNGSQTVTYSLNFAEL